MNMQGDVQKITWPEYMGGIAHHTLTMALQDKKAFPEIVMRFIRDAHPRVNQRLPEPGLLRQRIEP